MPPWRLPPPEEVLVEDGYESMGEVEEEEVEEMHYVEEVQNVEEVKKVEKWEEVEEGEEAEEVEEVEEADEVEVEEMENAQCTVSRNPLCSISVTSPFCWASSAVNGLPSTSTWNTG